jgi:hypothetical protein
MSTSKTDDPTPSDRPPHEPVDPVPLRDPPDGMPHPRPIDDPRGPRPGKTMRSRPVAGVDVSLETAACR